MLGTIGKKTRGAQLVAVWGRGLVVGMLLLAWERVSSVNGVGVSCSFPEGHSSSLTAGLAAVRTGTGGKLPWKAGSIGGREDPAGDGGGRAWRRERRQ